MQTRLPIKPLIRSLLFTLLRRSPASFAVLCLLAVVFLAAQYSSDSVASPSYSRSKSSKSQVTSSSKSTGPKTALLPLVGFSDGDTLKVIYRGKRESLRLIGIDTPETHENKRLYKMVKRTGRDKNTIMRLGKRSLEYAQSLVTIGDDLSVEFDVTKRDKYGRLLGYVFLKDGRLFQEAMLKAGHAELFTYPPNVKYVERLRAAAAQAPGKKS